MGCLQKGLLMFKYYNKSLNLNVIQEFYNYIWKLPVGKILLNLHRHLLSFVELPKRSSTQTIDQTMRFNFLLPCISICFYEDAIKASKYTDGENWKRIFWFMAWAKDFLEKFNQWMYIKNTRLAWRYFRFVTLQRKQ